MPASGGRRLCRTGMVSTNPALRIIVVEDDAVIGMLLADMLIEMGHTVDTIVSTEDAAVAAAARYKPDLMIVDAKLREGSGLSAIDRILSTGPMAHVYISGAAIHSAGRDPIVLLKPFVEADLVRAIGRALGTATR